MDDKIKKAFKIYKQFKEHESSVNSNFVTSKGGFEKFKKCFAIHSIRIQGESIDHEIESKRIRTYPKKIQNIIEEQRYKRANQVFNAETGFWWEKMPNRIFISKKGKIRI